MLHIDECAILTAESALQSEGRLVCGGDVVQFFLDLFDFPDALGAEQFEKRFQLGDIDGFRFLFDSGEEFVGFGFVLGEATVGLKHTDFLALEISHGAQPNEFRMRGRGGFYQTNWDWVRFFRFGGISGRRLVYRDYL